MDKQVLQRIRNLLDQAEVAYREVHHEPTYTSEESARARGEDIRTGGKAIVLKVGDVFSLFVLSAALRIDSTALKAYFLVKKIRFADAHELKDLTGLVPGSVPPFGRPILPLDLYMEHSIQNNEKIAFNAGSLTDSIIMQVDDYIDIARPTMLKFGRE